MLRECIKFYAVGFLLMGGGALLALPIGRWQWFAPVLTGAAGALFGKWFKVRE